ncbi:MAG: hypothetical protein QM635_06585 [Microbacteriaceae bacterium]
MSLPAYAPARPRPTVPVRRVEIVPGRAWRRARPRPLYAVIAISGVFGLFLAQLLLSIAVSNGAYRIASLQSERTELQRQQESLSEQVDVLSSTQSLAEKASALGMVPSDGTPAFLDVAKGKVIGTASAASASASDDLDAVPNALLPSEDDDTSTDDTATEDTSAEDTESTAVPTDAGAIDVTDSTSTSDSTGESDGTTTESSVASESSAASEGDGLPTPTTH